VLVTAGIAAADRARQTQPQPMRGHGFGSGRLLLAVGTGGAVWAATGWPAAGMWAAVAGWAVPAMIREDRGRGEQTAQLDGLATAGAGGQIGDVLTQLAVQLRARAASARRVERERRRTRLAGRAAAAVAAGWMIAGSRVNGSLFGVYATGPGQMLLAALIGVV